MVHLLHEIALVFFPRRIGASLREPIAQAPLQLNSVPFDDANQIGIIVRPDLRSRRRIEGRPVSIRSQFSQVGLGARHHDPLRSEYSLVQLPAGADGIVVNEARQPGVASQSAKDGRELQVVVADVEGKRSSRRELAQVQRHCFPGHQVHGNGICAEGIDDDQVITVVGGVAQLEPRIAENNGRMGRALAEKGEVMRVRCDALDGGIDLVKVSDSPSRR